MAEAESESATNVVACFPNLDECIISEGLMIETETKTEDSDPEQIALSNDLVLKKIFSYLSIGEISHCRVVCLKWKETADPVFNDRIGEVYIVFNGDHKKPSDVPLFLTMLEDSKLEFETFRFKNYPMEDPSVKLLFSRYASSITKLEFNYDRQQVDRYGDDLEETAGTPPGITNLHLRHILVNGAPFLEELEIINLPPAMKKQAIFKAARYLIPPPLDLEIRKLTLHFKYRTGKFEGLFLNDLVRNSTKLQELRVKSDFDCYEETLTLLNAIKAAPVIIPNLTRLDLASVDGHIMDLLATKFTSSHLRRFTCKPLSEFEEKQLEIFLDTQKGTLEHLSLSFSSEDDLSINLPIIPNLKYLKLNFSYTGGHVSINVLSYATMFPKLEIFKLLHRRSKICSYNSDEWFSAQAPCTTLRYLTLPGDLENSGLLTCIAEIFPDITKLNLAAQKYQVLRCLWTVWPNLKILAISLDSEHERKCGNSNSDDSGNEFRPSTSANIRQRRMSLDSNAEHSHSHIIDSILTGIPEAECKILAKKFAKLGELELSEEDIAELEAHRTGASICDLKGEH